MKRAQETSSIIEQFLPNVKTVSDSMIVEGYPIPPEPPISSWKPEVSVRLYLYIIKHIEPKIL